MSVASLNSRNYAICLMNASSAPWQVIVDAAWFVSAPNRTHQEINKFIKDTKSRMTGAEVKMGGRAYFKVKAAGSDMTLKEKNPVKVNGYALYQQKRADITGKPPNVSNWDIPENKVPIMANGGLNVDFYASLPSGR